MLQSRMISSLKSTQLDDARADFYLSGVMNNSHVLMNLSEFTPQIGVKSACVMNLSEFMMNLSEFAPPRS